MDFSSLSNVHTAKPTVVHILWDGDFGGIQRIVKNVFLDDTTSLFRHVAILAGHFGPMIGPAALRLRLSVTAEPQEMNTPPSRRSMFCGLLLSAIRNLGVNQPHSVGVPEITPSVDMDMPVGSPCNTEYV